MWQVDKTGKQVIIAAVGDKTSKFEDFLAQLPPNDCRYAVYDYQYINSEGIAYNKIVFLNWYVWGWLWRGLKESVVMLM